MFRDNHHAGRFGNPAVKRYLHDLSSDLDEHVANVTSALSLFIETGKSLHFTQILSPALPYSNISGIPIIRSAQSSAAENPTNLLTIATFFSSVTATSLQFSFGDTNNPAANAVNALWFSSLVLSIGRCSPFILNDLLSTTR